MADRQVRRQANHEKMKPVVRRISVFLLAVVVGLCVNTWHGDQMDKNHDDYQLVDHAGDRSNLAGVAYTSDSHRILQTDMSMNITINLELAFVNATVAEMLGPQEVPLNDLSSHFCWAVSEQASGTQVTAALAGTGTVIETPANSSHFGCSILATDWVIDSRGELLFGVGYDVILYVRVQQLVYISAVSFLSQAEVGQIVDLGFKRGSGGRVAFRSRLRANPSFDTIANIETFTDVPSPSPTGLPSMLPSKQPTVLPSRFMTTPPAVSMPSPSPSVRSSTFVSQSPSSGTGEISSNPRGSKVIYGSILGGVGALLVLSLLLLCTWFPISSRSPFASGPSYITRTAESTDLQRHSGARQARQITGADVVQSDASQAITQPNGPVTAILVNIGISSSFDDISVYTTGSGSAAALKKGFQAHQSDAVVSSLMAQTLTSAIPQDAKAKLDAQAPIQRDKIKQETANQATLTASAEAFSASKYHELPTSASNCSGQNDIRTARMGVGRGYQQLQDSVKWQECDLFIDSIPPLQRSQYAASQAVSFEDDVEENTHNSASQLAEERSQPSASSSRTPRIRNTTDYRRQKKLLQEEKSDIIQDMFESESGMLGNGQSDAKGPWDIDLSSNDGATTTYSTMSNESLLRSILEDARLLSNRPKMLPVDDVFLEKFPDFEESKAQSVMSCSSKHGGLFALNNSTFAEHSQHAIERPMMDFSEGMHFEKEFASVRDDANAKSKGFHHPGVENGRISAHVRSTHVATRTVSALPSISDYVIIVSKTPGSETPASSPGILGIRAPTGIATPRDDSSSGSQDTGNPWLFDTIEQTLGQRSATADMESISGRSVRTGRSNQSQQSPVSYGQDLATKVSRTTANAAASSGSGTSAGKPESHRHDVKVLDVHINMKHPDVEQSSSITASSDSASQHIAVSAIRSDSECLFTKNVIVPAGNGKLGVVLADHHDGRGVIVSEVRQQCVLRGKLLAGDRLVEIDRQDVSNMTVPQITALMASKKDGARLLTVLSSRLDTQEEQFDSRIA